MSRNSSRCILLQLIAAACLIAPAAGLAQSGNGNPNPSVIPINARYAGLTYAEWAARWFQWMYATSGPNSPLLDTSGDGFAIGQSGHVWFLAEPGPTDTHKTARNINLPSGKALLFPCFAGDTLFVFPPGTPVEVLQASTWFYFQFLLGNPGAEVDGVAIKELTSYKVVTDGFYVTAPADSIFGLSAGTYGPDVSPGYWILLAPLSAGQHTVHYFYDILLPGPFSGHWEVTYNINVVPGD